MSKSVYPLRTLRTSKTSPRAYHIHSVTVCLRFIGILHDTYIIMENYKYAYLELSRLILKNKY